MRRFAALYDELDQTNATREKVAAMMRYFADAPPDDAAWALFFLSGERLRSPVRSGDLAAWAGELAGVTGWMFDACYEAVGDRAETIALLIDAVPNRCVRSRWSPTLTEAVTWVERLRGAAPEQQRANLLEVWGRLAGRELFLFTKLMTGALRVGVSRRLVVRALSAWSGVPAQVILHRLMGHWQPGADAFRALFDGDLSDADRSRPYPYFLASPLEGEVELLGPPESWQAEWKWDGIRAQLVRRGGEVWLWSRGEEVITAQYPEIVEAAAALPEGSVLDGEILAWRELRPLPFAQLQRRLGRKQVGRKLRAEVPCVFMAYDQMEAAGRDLRAEPLGARRARLEQTLRGSSPVLMLSPTLDFLAWAQLAEQQAASRHRGVEGVMLKHIDSPYRVGRVRGDWWKWKIAPLEMDAVLIYAQPGHGRRAGLFTDYTFALWSESGDLVPVAKAYSGLDDAEIRELDRWIRRNTVDRFGPVRAVTPSHVFQLHFENVSNSTRHKSGVAVRFPRIARWRRDLTPAQADSLAHLKRLIQEPADV